MIAQPLLLAMLAAPLLPESGAVSSWGTHGTAKTYSQQDLYGYINGGAEIFFEMGFEKLLVQEYGNSGSQISVEVFVMSDQTAALGIYLLKCGRETPDPGVAARHTVGRHLLMLVQNRYFVQIHNLDGSAERRPDLLAFGRTIKGLLAADGQLPLLNVLPTKGQVAGTMRFLRGPLALNAIVTLGQGDVLELGRKVTAVAADYRDEAGTHTRIAVPYPSGRAAQHALDHLKAHLDSRTTKMRDEPDRLMFRDYAGKVNVVTVRGNRMNLQIGLETTPAP
ncbi:DUF6599 family protein [Myxococcota bacterium]